MCILDSFLLVKAIMMMNVPELPGGKRMRPSVLLNRSVEFVLLLVLDSPLYLSALSNGLILLSF